jgi:hypothetical protein
MVTSKNEFCGTCDSHIGDYREHDFLGDDDASHSFIDRCHCFVVSCRLHLWGRSVLVAIEIGSLKPLSNKEVNLFSIMGHG